VTDLTNLANNYDDLYYPSIQKSIVDAYKSGSSLGNIINSIIKINNKRAQIKYGLYQRTKLKSASQFEWSDPREADGVPIYAKPKLGSTKVNNKLHTPFDRAIISTNSGYFAGITPNVTTTNENADLEKYNLDSILMEMTQTSIGRGSGYTLLSIKEGELYINPVGDWSSVVMYDYITKQPVFGLVYEKQLSMDTDERPDEYDYYNIWFYNERELITGVSCGNSFKETSRDIHGLNSIPLVEFPNNTERVGDVELTLSLQDAYDIANSDLSSEISQLRLAYLLIKNEGKDFGDEDLKRLTNTGVLLLDGNGDSNFIEKSLNSTPVEQLKNDLEKDIYKYSLSYDPDANTSGDITAFQIQQSMTKMEESAIEREKVFTVSIKRIINMIAGFTGLTGESTGEFEAVQYSRNVPSNIINDLKGMREAGLMVDQETLSELAPLKLDYEEIKERLLEQKQSIMAELDKEEDIE
jgi:SPP1 family phage portal protein